VAQAPISRAPGFYPGAHFFYKNKKRIQHFRFLGYNESMNSAPVYLVERFFYRIRTFLEHWYVVSFRKYSDFVLNLLSQVDYYLAWKITLRYLFQPLYKDYSVLGYILGFIFRSVRLVAAAVVYLILFLIIVGIYLFWLLVPPLIIYLIFT
jgi:hypothetical protein